MIGDSEVSSKTPASSASLSAVPRGCVARSTEAGTVQCVACGQCVLCCVAAQRLALRTGPQGFICER
jgi:ferredoxin